ncbi:MAG: F0F1 ATP synthase subunit A [Myxococcales bacterium]|nr:F0F1 ATP synthase subunit A [Myxococcota bacterium]MDW8281215.1 F0F1 ATP synthase subunit A [Myxococcales bacterium]
MGEESSWFDYLPGLRGLEQWAQHYLGRVDRGDAFYFRGGPFTDSHFTLVHVLFALVVVVFVTLGALSFARAMRRGGQEAIVPPEGLSLRNVFEMITDAVWSLTSSIMGEKNGRRYLPLIGTLAFFIFFSNILALIPGMLPPTATLKTNVALALTVFVITHIEGIRAQGAARYVRHFLGPWPWLLPLSLLLLVIELIGHLARPLSLSLRLLGNIASDHKVVGVFFVLVPLALPVPFLILGTLVAIIQTLVFCLLSMVYINMAVTVHDHEDHGAHAPAHAH